MIVIGTVLPNDYHFSLIQIVITINKDLPTNKALGSDLCIKSI